MQYALAVLLFIFSFCAQAQNTLFPANPGDMIVKGGASAWVPVPGGTAGCVLTSNGPAAAPTWQCALALNFQLPPMATSTVWGNVSGAQARASQINISQFLNTIDYDVQRPPLPGSIPYKGTDNLWHTLAATGAGGRCLISGGPSAPPFFGPCATNTVLNIDVFTIAGQSNAVGNGTAAQSCTLPAGVAYQYYLGAVTSIIGDPVGNAISGSAWPCFALAYYNATGRRLLFVPTAVGSAAQVAAADTGAGNWDDPALGGTLYDASVASTNGALTAATLAGFAPLFKGILWAQGETDAFAVGAGTITVNAYKLALVGMITRYRGVYGATMPFYLFRLGRNDISPDPGFDGVRQGQEDQLSVDKYSRVVFRASIDFWALGMMTVGTLHYNQSGLNFMGQVGAMNIIAADAHNGWQTYTCPYNVCTPNTTRETTWYANGSVGIGPGSAAAVTTALDAAVPPSLLYVLATDNGVKQQTLKSSGTGGVGIDLNALGTGGREWGVISAANGSAQCGGGAFCVFDFTAGLPRLIVNTTGGLRMPSYGAGVPVFDGSGNISVVGSPFTGTKTVRASGGASDCTLIFDRGVLTGGSC